MDTAEVIVAMLQTAVVVSFLALAGIALSRAWRSGAAAWWVTGAFTTLAVSLAGLWANEWVPWSAPSWVYDAAVGLALAFPYLMLRFAASLRPVPRLLEGGAAVVGVAAVATVVAGSAVHLPVQPIARVYWAAVSTIVVARLWRAGRGQPGVARRRMRLMAAGTAMLAIALLSARLWKDVLPAEIVTHGMTALSALVFGVGFAPPRPLRLSWRRDEDAKVQAATASLVQATSVEDVGRQLLPATVAILGADRAVLLDDRGRVIAREGHAPRPGEVVDPKAHPDAEVAALDGGRGSLVAWTGAYSPFFGPEERGLFRGLAAVAGLAMQRCELLADERARHAATEHARRQADAARAEAERARQEADAANQSKSRFISRMSHELRTPLNAVLGFGQLLEVADLTPEDRDAVRHILKAGRHLLALIDDVLDLSRVEAETLAVSLEPVHVGELIRDSISLVTPVATPRRIGIHLDETGCDRYVRTDRQRCRQILLNLLSNAVKYNHDFGTVMISCLQPDDTTVRIVVRDTGPGIDPSRQSRLFEPFDRLGAEETGVQGTGLGLALSRQLVERLDGAMGVDSAPGDGSTFWIDLPLTAAPPTPREDTPMESVSVASPTEQSETLLLVEDNLANLRLVQALMRRQRPGITILPAMQGAMALEMAFEHLPSVVLLDLHLPDMHGREVLAQLRADPRTRDIPVVVASADATPGRVRQLLDEGAFDYLTKPLELRSFLDVVDAALMRGT